MMLWLILMISFSTEINTKLVLNETKAPLIKNASSWNEIKEHCGVPTKSEVEQNKNPELQLDQNVTAWTASWVNVNDWAHFYGCLDLDIDVSGPITAFKQILLRKYFPEENNATEKTSIFDCVAECFTKTNYFMYYKKICQCATTPIKSYKKETCIKSCQFYNDVFCSSGKRLALFKIERNIETEMEIFDNISRTRLCLASKNNTTVVTDCSSAYHFRCEGSGSVYEFNWTKAVNTCINGKSILPLASKSSNIVSWLGYFSVRELLNESSHRHCTSVSWSRHYYEYENRNCSELLPFLCQLTESGLTTLKDTATPVIIDNDAGIRQTTNVKNSKPESGLTSLKDTATPVTIDNNASIRQTTNVKISKPVVIIVVNVVLLVLCIVVMIAYCRIKKIKQAIRKRSSNKHITNKHAATLARVNIHRQDDGDGYVEAWDQHHDIVGME